MFSTYNNVIFETEINEDPTYNTDTNPVVFQCIARFAQIDIKESRGE